MGPAHEITESLPSEEERRRFERRTPTWVQEFCVRIARAVEIKPDHSSVDPALALDIGRGQLLLLAGQWLWDERTYGAPAAAGTDDVLDACLDRQPPPHAFLGDAFTLRRSAATGEVWSIRVKGVPLVLGPAIQGVKLTQRRPQYFDSWIIEARLEDLPRILGGHQSAITERHTSGLFYYGTKEEVCLGDHVRIKRWFRADFEGTVSYIPGVSPFRREYGTDQWMVEEPSGRCIGWIYAPDQAQPPRSIVLVARCGHPPH